MRKFMLAALSVAAAALFTVGAAGVATADNGDMSGSVSCGNPSNVLAVPITLAPETFSCSAQSAPPAAAESDD